jgi:ketol-acid reductoisomerase
MHALNLRESGVSVVVGLPEGSRSRAKAQADGVTVPRRAAGGGGGGHHHDPDAGHGAGQAVPRIHREEPPPGKTLMFAHGFNIRFGNHRPARGVDVPMIAPKALRTPRARSLSRRARARPRCCAVHSDASGSSEL